MHHSKFNCFNLFLLDKIHYLPFGNDFDIKVQAKFLKAESKSLGVHNSRSLIGVPNVPSRAISIKNSMSFIPVEKAI